MAERFFPNEMPNFIPETAEAEKLAEKAQDSLTKLLHLPYKNVAEKIQKSALVLKEKIVEETWVAKGKRVNDYSLYTGALGTAFLLFKAYQVSKDGNDLALCSEIISACDLASRGSGHELYIFLWSLFLSINAYFDCSISEVFSWLQPDRLNQFCK